VPQILVVITCAALNMDIVDQLQLIVELVALEDLALDPPVDQQVDHLATDCPILPLGTALLQIAPLEAASLDPAAHILVILDLESQRLTQPYSEQEQLAPMKDLHAANATTLLDPLVPELLI